MTETGCADFGSHLFETSVCVIVRCQCVDTATDEAYIEIAGRHIFNFKLNCEFTLFFSNSLPFIGVYMVIIKRIIVISNFTYSRNSDLSSQITE